MILWIVLPTTIIFIIEIITPQGVGEAILYIGPILIALFSENKRIIYGTVILSTILTIAGYFLSPASIEPWKSVVNRSLVISAFWVVTFVGMKRIQIEESLYKSQERYRNALDNLMEGAQIIGFDWRYLYVNDTAAKHGRQTKENLLGRTMMEMYPGIEHTAIFATIKLCMEERTSHMMENEFRYPNGDQGWFELSIQPVEEGVFVLSNDITQRKLAEEKLQQLNVHLEKRVSERTLSLNIANAQLRDELTRRQQAEKIILQQNKTFSSLHEITLDLLKHQDVEKLLNRLVELSAFHLDAPYASIALLEDDTLVVKAVTKNQTRFLGQKLKQKDAILTWQAFETQKPIILNDYDSWIHRRKEYEDLRQHAVADIPILMDKQCIGVLALGRDQLHYEFTDDQIQFGNLFANLTALIIENAQLRDTLKQQSIRDPLTGLFNRRYMEEMLKREIKRVTRQLHSLGIIMIDIDHFKSFNDKFGHVIGDKLLRDVGRFLQIQVRGEDIACRYGGEEFILIMPDTQLETLKKRAEKVRKEVKQIKLEGVNQELTLSLGVAMYPQHGKNIADVIHAADRALYQAKQNGRNRVEVANEIIN